MRGLEGLLVEPKSKLGLWKAAFDTPLTADERVLCGRACRRTMGIDDAVRLGEHAVERALEHPSSRPYAEFIRDSAALMRPHERAVFYPNALSYLGLPCQEALRRLAADDGHLRSNSPARDLSAPLLLGHFPDGQLAGQLYSSLESSVGKWEILDRVAHRELGTGLDLAVAVYHDLRACNRPNDWSVSSDLRTSATVGAREIEASAHQAGNCAEVGSYAETAVDLAPYLEVPELERTTAALLGRWGVLRGSAGLFASADGQALVQASGDKARRRAATQALSHLAEQAHRAKVEPAASPPAVIDVSQTSVRIGSISLDRRGA